MRRVLYAEINEEGYCFHVTDCELPLSNRVLIVENDSVLGMRWDGEKWNEVEPDPIPEPQPTQLDEIQNTQLLIMAAIADQYEENLQNQLMQMDVQATIYETLLEIQEGASE